MAIFSSGVKDSFVAKAALPVTCPGFIKAFRYNKIMTLKSRSILLVGVLLAGLAVGVIYWGGAPRLVAHYPADGASLVPAGAALRLEFSRLMRPETVEARLRLEPSLRGSSRWEGKTLFFTPDPFWPAGQILHVTLQPGARAQSPFAAPMLRGASWSFAIRQPQMAYLSPSSGPADVYLFDPASGESLQVTAFELGVQDLTASARGDHLYFSAREAQGGSGIYRLDLSAWEVGASPSVTPVLALACPQAICRAPAISPDGSLLAYERTGQPGSGEAGFPQVWLLPLEGESQIASVDSGGQGHLAGDPGHQTLLPAWSSTGLLAFYDTDAAAFVILDPQSGEARLFPNQTGQPGSWRPDGQAFVAPEILFSGDSTSPARLTLLAYSHLILFDILENNSTHLTPAEDIEDTSPSFSPDGKYLAFARKYLDAPRWTPGRQLWLLHLGVGEAQPMTAEPFYNHYEFAWSPAGDQLAFVRFNQAEPTAPLEIWLLVPLTGEIRRVITGGYAPIWIP